jgi:P4 family phage/plasmid primase-like protien
MNTKNSSLEEYLHRNIIEKGDEYTHTRIGDKSLKIMGGTYFIKNREEFLEIYHKSVFIDGKEEYLTEKQSCEVAPLAVDIDMRYEPSIDKKQHDEDDVRDMINLYVTKLSKICSIPNGHKVEIFVMEKPNVNMLEKTTKDGIHIIFGVSIHRAAQIYLREEILNDIKNIWKHIPIINSEEDLIDEGVTRGMVNWQLYGSRKPGQEAYAMKYHYELEWSAHENKWEWKSFHIKDFNIKKNLNKLSIQHTFPVLSCIDSLTEKLEDYKLTIKKKRKMASKPQKTSSAKPKDICDVTTQEELAVFVTEMLEKFELSPTDYELAETHKFTMMLSEKYYGPGSYSKWIRVGWALKNTSIKLLPSWLSFSSKSKEFNFTDIPTLIEKWNKFDYENPDSLTNRSIMYWAKTDNFMEYDKIRKETISYFIDLTIANHTEFDFANVLYQFGKDNFVCISIKNNIWYEYRGNRWHEIDSGNTLRLIISKQLHDIYMKKSKEAQAQLLTMEQTDDNYETTRKRSNKLAEVCVLLKKTTWKNNIMREAKELFYDKNFLNKLDQNPYLLCFNNFVIDFNSNTYRSGQPDDYISKCTNIDFVPYQSIVKSKEKEEIETFINQLFPKEELRAYMWEHLASTLIGNNDNQTFNMYTGSGRNGKSKLVDLMSKTLGDYKAMVPITLLTQKRTQIGSTSSEIVQLMGIRYAVMQEPSKGEKINEGIMKEITGGDNIQGRALFKEAVTFKPQFKLVVCTNTLLEIKSNDDGTWRRIRVCDFVSKFLEQPFEDEENFPKEDYPYQYTMDRHIDEKFTSWAPVFASMLVNITFQKKGKVTDCKTVLCSSDKYREGQDYLTEFCKEKIKKTLGGKIKKTEAFETFKQWYTHSYGKNVPKARELNEFMDKKFGKYTTCWINVAINYDDDEDEDDV